MKSTFSKRIKRTLSALLAALMVLGTVAAAAPEKIGSAVAAEDEGTIELVPAYSDGITITIPDDGALTIQAHREGSRYVFDETKTLEFTAVYAEGWTPCEQYSVFFPGDSRAAANDNGDGSVTFTFEATEGGKVDISDFEAVQINAAAAELPKLHIETEIPLADINRKEWVNAEYRLEPGTKQFTNGSYEGSGMIKGRGNSSWIYDKKAYSIKLDSKASLLDIPKTKKYAIIPNWHDATHIRNYITYKAFQSLIGIGYVPKCEIVDVYVNGEYRGIYLLTERIDVEKSKVNIEEANENDITGGYLIEKDVAQKIDFTEDICFNCPYWANQSQDYFVLKAPEPEEGELRDAMLAYLENYMQTVHDAIMNDPSMRYTDYVDVSSWIDMIIVQEITKNPDGNFKTSCWMYKESGDDHIYMTAPWDFDLGYGVVSICNASEEHNDVDDCPNSWTPRDFMAINSSSPWYDSLYDTRSEFNLALKARYTTYRCTICNELFRLINEQAAYLSIVQEANYELWDKPFDPAVTKLINWLRQRLAWLDGEWLLEDGDIDLDDALNIYGGTLEFTCEGEEHPFIGVARLGEAVGAANEDGAAVRLEAELVRGDFISFDHLVPQGAELRLYVNGEEKLLIEGDGVMNTARLRVSENGEYEFRWVFTGCGEALLDEISIDLGTVIGDVNMDGSVTIVDAIIALRLAMGIFENEEKALLADVNGDGSVTVSDGIVIMRRAMGIL